MSDMETRAAFRAFRWSVRGVDPRLVRRLRIEAIERGRPIAELVNQALEAWLNRDDER